MLNRISIIYFYNITINTLFYFSTNQITPSLKQNLQNVSANQIALSLEQNLQNVSAYQIAPSLKQNLQYFLANQIAPLLKQNLPTNYIVFSIN